MTVSLRSIIEHATSLRHELHQQPETAWEEHRTAARIRDELDSVGIRWRPCAGTGTIATLAPDAPGPMVALRADMDALPIQETSGVPWRSRVDGKMHACGHDGHSATLLGVARYLVSRQPELAGPVRLLFQPAEEGGHGARRMIEEGALAGVDRIFGWHNWPAIEEGKAVCPDGPVMCANGAFSIEILGQGGHSSQPELCRDPVLAAASVTVALQQVVARRSRPQAPSVVSVTNLKAESGLTTIPDTAQLSGSIRASSDTQRSEMEAAIEQIAHATALAHQTKARVTFLPRYGATVNHSGPAQEMRRALSEVLSDPFSHSIAVPIMASEDFSYYLREIPGAFALVGAGTEERSVPCHNSSYDFNDRLISTMARVYVRLVGLELDA